MRRGRGGERVRVRGRPCVRREVRGWGGGMDESYESYRGRGPVHQPGETASILLILVFLPSYLLLLSSSWLLLPLLSSSWLLLPPPVTVCVRSLACDDKLSQTDTVSGTGSQLGSPLQPHQVRFACISPTLSAWSAASIPPPRGHLL